MGAMVVFFYQVVGSSWEQVGVVGLLLVAVSGFLAARVLPKSTVEKMLETQKEAHDELTLSLKERIQRLEKEVDHLRSRDVEQGRTLMDLSRASTTALERLSDIIETMREIRMKEASSMHMMVEALATKHPKQSKEGSIGGERRG